MKTLIFAFIGIILVFGMVSCHRPNYGAKSRQYKATQRNIKHHGKNYKPYQKENVFQQGINLITGK